MAGQLLDHPTGDRRRSPRHCKNLQAERPSTAENGLNEQRAPTFSKCVLEDPWAARPSNVLTTSSICSSVLEASAPGRVQPIALQRDGRRNGDGSLPANWGRK